MANRLAVPAGIDALQMTVQPMSVRTDYKLSTSGHRMLGSVKGVEVIDTGWQATAARAAQIFGRELGKLATVKAAAYQQ